VTLRTGARRLPPRFWWLWAATFTNRLGTFLVPFLAFYLTQKLGYSVGTSGAVVTTFALGGVVGSFVGGRLADDIGYGRTLSGAGLVAAAAVGALAVVHELAAIVVLVLLYGAANSAVRPVTYAMVADVAPPAELPRAYALTSWATNVGYALSPIVGGLLAAQSYTALFVCDAATTLAFVGIAAARLLDHEPPESPVAQGEAGALPERTVLRDRAFVGVLALNTIFTLVYMQQRTTLPIVMARSGLNPSTFGTVFAVNGGLVVLLQVPATRLLSRFPRDAVLALGTLLTGVGFGLTVWCSSALAYAGAIAVWTLGEIAYAPFVNTLVAELAPRAARGRYQGVYQTTANVASFAAPILGAFLLERGGEAGLWGSCVAACSLAAVGQLAAAESRRQRIHALSARST
jgi:MFS family permease